jgi:hypothetical protein
MTTPLTLSMTPSNPKFAEEFLKHVLNETVSFKDYPKLLKAVRSHKVQSIDRHKNFLERLLKIPESNDLLKSLVYFNVSKKSDRYEKMLMSFHKYLKSNAQKMTLFDDQTNSTFFEDKREDDALHYIYKWSYFLKTGEELLYCDGCDSLLVPTFRKSDTYVCGNTECAEFNKTRYHNHCWNCNSSIDSMFNAQCSSCDWYICNTCNSCQQGLVGGCKNQKKKDILVKHYIQLQPMEEDFPKVFSIWKSLIEKYLKGFKNRKNAWKDANTERGTKVLKSELEVYQYGTLYYGHHIAKLKLAFEQIQMSDFHGKQVEVFDWGCGQALATLCFLEKYLSSDNRIDSIVKIHLIEPSQMSLTNGRNFIENNFQVNEKQINSICKGIDDINVSEILKSDSPIQVHLMSNILDVDKFDIDKFIKAHSSQTTRRKYYICVSPNYKRAKDRVSRFYEGMNSCCNVKLISKEDSTIRAKIFNVKKNEFVDRYVTRFQIIFSYN